MLDQNGSISDEENGFEDTRERLVELRDLPRRYADALKAKDAETLRALLKDGREKKATAGGN